MPKARMTPRRRQVVVYLDEHDEALLSDLTRQTGLAKTEVFRQGLRRMADEKLAKRPPGASLAHLIATARADGLPEDLAARHDEYLYAGGYGKERAE